MDQFVYYYKFDSIKSEIEKFDVGMIEAKDDIYCTVLFLRLNKSITILKKDLKKINLVKTGDEFENKICDRCYKYLNTEELFSNNRIKKGNKITKRPSCKNCRKLIDGKSITKIEKMRWIKIKPINELFSCPICNKKSIAGLTKIVLDHDHKTGHVRGYICESCNTGIGRFKDDILLLKNAIKWLENN